MQWLLIIVGAVLWLTCPDKADHQKAVNDKVKEILLTDPNGAALNGILAMAGYDVGDVAGNFVQVGNYKNWVLFSTASFMDIKTLGVLGNVFFLGGNGGDNDASGEQRTMKNTNRHKSVRAEGDRCHISCDGQGMIDGTKMDAKLYVRYRDEDRWQIYVKFGIKLFSESPKSAACRCGGNDWHHDPWGASSSADATFYHGDRVALVNEMGRHSHFEMTVKASNGSNCSASFDGVGEKVQELIDYYNEKNK